ncbi:MAG TPA: aromatic-ring-hydroxylating dioxygenase subunit beta [Stellaceae bacterium]|nr:aromatic-ring-hydroxylating dioxygenase subunit beta [Stellaceae bacterium]
MDLARISRRLEIAELYADYVACLDGDELERWPDFFVEEAIYRITSAENYEAELPLGLIYATSRNMLKDRVAALREANIYEPQRYRHLVSAIRLVRDEGEAVEATANFAIVRTLQDAEMTIFAAGRYLDTLRRADGAWKFARKLVLLDSRQIDTLLAIPM